MKLLGFFFLLLSIGSPALASECSEMETYDVTMGMCMPLAMEGMPMRMLMLSGNVFGGYTSQQGPRGRNAGWSTSMVMLDAGTSVGDRHYLGVELMATAERWTIPERGYPLLLQVGENDAKGNPFVDAQHPHSSPIMGLTFSDTIRLGSGKDFLRVFFAPRGESTDGPTAFMHRPTGMVNPDAPLGHHVGQDVGHITSTVLGASLRLGKTRFEASTFHGAEPEPTKVDLPIGRPDSLGVRVVEEFSEAFTAMASFAYVAHPEPHDPDVGHVNRYSASVYHHATVLGGWELDHALIYGGISGLDHADFLSSFAGEFWLRKGRPNFWGRVELLQRTAGQLDIATVPAQDAGRWVTAVTLGYTHTLVTFDEASLGLGASVTKNFIPDDFSPAYGGNPWSAKVFLHLKGMKMWSL